MQEENIETLDTLTERLLQVPQSPRLTPCSLLLSTHLLAPPFRRESLDITVTPLPSLGCHRTVDIDPDLWVNTPYPSRSELIRNKGKNIYNTDILDGMYPTFPFKHYIPSTSGKQDTVRILYVHGSKGRHSRSQRILESN